MNVVVAADHLPHHRLVESCKELQYRHTFQIAQFNPIDQVAASVLHYDGYPWQSYDDAETLILLEGLIYNKGDAEIRDRLREIADEYSAKSEGFRGHIVDFVGSCDGDYLVFIFLKKEASALIFNDRWGRLPTYYSRCDSVFALSREIKFLLHWIPSIEFDAIAMAEFLIYEYNLGDKTLVKGVKRLNPASLVVVKHSLGRVCVTEETLLPVDFATIDLNLSRDDIIRQCVQLFKESLLVRVNKTQEKRLNMITDLSGGFDTRAVFAGLCQLRVPFRSCCDVLITGDESNVARQLAGLFGRDLQVFRAYHPIEDFSVVQDIIYITECTENIYGSVSVYYDELEREKKLTGPAAHFMGFGGEVIRHPYHPKRGYRDVAAMLKDGRYTRHISASFACAMTKLNRKEFAENLECEVARLPEKNDRDRVKHLYFEYYNKMVNGGENRHRLFAWTVQPLWGKSLFEFEMKNIPARLISYRFFIDFLSLLDCRSLKAPVYGRPVRLDSTVSVLLFDLRTRLRELLGAQRFTYKLHSWLVRMLPRRGASEEYRRLTSEVLKIYRASRFVSEYFDNESIQEFLERRPSILEIYQLLTLMVYVQEVGNRFAGKMACVGKGHQRRGMVQE